MKLHRVLIAIEDDNFKNSIAEFIAGHHWPEQVEFLLLHVVKPSYRNELESYEQLKEIAREVGSGLIQQIARTIRESVPGCSVEQNVVDGDPITRIVKASEEWKADLIVVGAHSHERPGFLPMGSVSNAVSASAPCSVLVVRLEKVSRSEEAVS